MPLWQTVVFCSNGLSVRVPVFPFRRGFSPQSRRTTLRGHLVLLVLVTLLPALLFSGLVFYLFARDERAALQSGLMETVRALRQAVDTKLKSNINTLEALAASDMLDRGDLQSFYRMTKRVLVSQEGWKTVILHDPSGRELLNLAVPFRAPPGTPVERKAFNDVLQTKQPAFVGFVASPRTGPVVALRAPVLRRNQVKYVITAAIEPKTFSDILVKQRLSPGLSATLFDQNRNIIARVPEPEKFIGQGVSAILDQLAGHEREGWAVGRSREGEKSYAVFSRSELSGYTIALVIPASAIEGPLRRSLLAVAAAGLIFLALGLGLAVAIGRRISEPIKALASSAEAIGKGGLAAALPVSSVVEVETLRGTIENSVRLLEERRQIEQERWESEQRFRAIFNQVAVGIAECEIDGRFLLVNDGYCAIVGLSREQLLAMRMQDLIHPDDVALYREQIQHLICGAHSPTERRYLRSDGSEIWVISDMLLVCDAEGRAQYFVAVSQDITGRKHAEEELYRLKDELENRVAVRTEELTRTNTELFRTLDQREKLEAQLRQAQKMEAIGALAGGIAHDFNNILGIIAVHASLLRNGKVNGDEAAEKGAAILDASQRGAALVQQLLTFAQERAVEHKPIDVNTLVSDLMKMMVNTFPRTIAFALDLDPDLPAIYGDQTQVEQALLNLALNARDAMPDGGRLTIRTARISGEDLRKAHPDAAARTYVKLEVDDTGAGMDEQVKERLFEPFFTTKKDLGGTGLGLPVVYGIVSSHRGLIDVDSVKGRGTAFRLYLPIRSTAEAAGRPPERAVLAGRGEGVLIVEDEKNLLALVETVLKRNGYEAFTAVHGEQAVDVYRRHKEEIDLVLLDLGLPIMDGREVYDALKRENPHVTVVISTGYVDPDVRIDLVKRGVNGFIQKPLTPQAVLQKIRSVLDRRKIIRGRKANVLAS
jgi:PAS domain S-box-containing protein